MPEDDIASDVVNAQLRQARQALADAAGARDAGLSDVVIINRLYYACFPAAQAVIYHRGHEPTSYRGVLSLFGSKVVVAGDATRQDGRFLNDLSELRNRADYGYGEIDEDVASLLTRTQDFVSDMEALCSSSPS